MSDRHQPAKDDTVAGRGATTGPLAHRPELHGFEGQTPVEHGLVLLAGAGIFLAIYGGLLWVAGGGPALLEARGPAAVASRRQAAVAAGIGCWVVFAVAFILGRGGPLLNTVFYPVTIVAAGPPLLAWLVTGTVPGYPLTTTGRLRDVAFAVDVLGVVGPGMGVAASLLMGWWIVWLDGPSRRRWIDRRLSPAFRSTFLGGFGSRTDRSTEHAKAK